MNKTFAPRPDLLKLSTVVYQGNKDRGFTYGEERKKTLEALVVCELCEAIEADRKSRRANVNGFIRDCMSDQVEFDASSFKEHIKDSVEDELADTIIRILDLFPRISWKQSLLSLAPDFKWGFVFDGNQTMCDQLLDAIDICRKKGIDEDIRLVQAIYYIEKMAEFHEIDIWYHVSLKLEFNATREHKHGKEY